MSNRKTQSASVSTLQPNPLPQDVEERIRQRAYELYLERGQQDGHSEEDWLRAEEEVLGDTRSQPAAA